MPEMTNLGSTTDADADILGLEKEYFCKYFAKCFSRVPSGLKTILMSEVPRKLFFNIIFYP